MTTNPITSPSESNQTFPDKKYDVIYADPPWEYNNKTIAKRMRGTMRYIVTGASQHYSTMTLDDVKALPVKDISKKDSALFLWATVPLLPDCIEVLKEWGFKYKTMITWRKILSHGAGYWFSGQTEHLLLGIKGQVKAFHSPDPNFYQSSILHTMHSQKPQKFRSMIERATKTIPNCQRIELFARHKIHGWDAWGNQLQTPKQLEAFQ